MSKPEYHYIDANEMSVHHDEDKKVKVIAGKYENAEGPIKKHNVEPIFFDVELNQNKQFSFSIPKSHNSFVYLVDGRIKIGNLSHDNIEGSKLVLLTNGNNLRVSAETNAKFLLIAGEPIGESIARGGPFVMNTKSEIIQAINDYNNGTFVR